MRAGSISPDLTDGFVFFIVLQGAVAAGVELCGGDHMAKSIHDSFERLKAGDEGAAIFKRDIGELMVRPREAYREL